MLRNAEYVRAIQKSANRNYERYKEIQRETMNMIIFAAQTGVNACHVEFPCSENDEHVMIAMLVHELENLGYGIFKVPLIKSVRLQIQW